MSHYKGTVTSFNDIKGFGFIRYDDGEVFVHYSAIQNGGLKALKEGQMVEFEIIEGFQGKPQAGRVRVVTSSPGPY